MAVYCGACAKERDLPRSAIRVANEPCQFCGGFESKTVRRARRSAGCQPACLVEHQKLNNFDYPDKLINSMPGSFEKQAHKEYEGVDLRGLMGRVFMRHARTRCSSASSSIWDVIDPDTYEAREGWIELTDQS